MAESPSIPSVETVLMRELDAAHRDIAQMRALVADAVQKLGAGFEGIVNETKSQQGLLEETLVQVDDNGLAGESVSQFIGQSERLIGQVSSDLEKASERTLSLANRLDEVDSTFRTLAKLSEQMLQVSEQIRVLAFNANFEAARAGQGGRGFAIVATAVRELSQSFRHLTEETRDAISDARTSIVETVTESRKAAQADHETVRQARDDTEHLHATASAINRQIAQSVEGAKRIGTAIESGVYQCVIALQFDDLIGQLCAGSARRIQACRSIIEASHEDPKRISDANAVSQGISALDAAQHRSVQQTSLDPGEVEIFL